MAVVIVREMGSDEWVVERVDDGLYILLMLIVSGVVIAYYYR